MFVLLVWFGLVWFGVTGRLAALLQTTKLSLTINNTLNVLSGHTMAIDVQLLKLQYEILNVSAESIAHSTGLPLSAIDEEIRSKGWTRMWPDNQEPPLEIAEGEDIFKLSSDRYIEKTRKRLYAYSLAKDVLLATRYLELESGLIAKANECLVHVDPQVGVAAVKALSALWKDMQKSASSATTFNADDLGLPTVVVKDLSGRSI